MEFVTAGESHGKALVAVVTGVPAGIPVTQEDLDRDLARRQVGYGRGGRMRIEKDSCEVLSGIRHGHTLGTPVALTVRNRDHEAWTEVMAPFGERTTDRRVSAPRPGHADLAGVLKTGATDVRDVLERASARETAARVAAGGLAKALLRALDVRVHSVVVRIGEAAVETGFDPAGADVERIEASDVRTHDPAAGERMRGAIDRARDGGDSLGGEFVVWAEGLPPGLGGYAEASRRLDAALCGAVASIPAIKAVGLGDGFDVARMAGSEVHDPIVKLEDGSLTRPTNHAGGVEGGMTNGETLVVRAAMKPIPTLTSPLPTVDLDTGEAADAARERSDVCAVPAAGVVAEAEVAMVLADAFTRKFGGDALADISTALSAYRERLFPGA